MAAPRAGAHIERRFAQKNQLKSAENVALHFRERATLQQAKSMTYLTSTRANCRRWVSGLSLTAGAQGNVDVRQRCRAQAERLWPPNTGTNLRAQKRIREQLIADCVRSGGRIPR